MFFSSQGPFQSFFKNNRWSAPLYRLVYFLRYSSYFNRIIRNLHRPTFLLRLWRWHAFDRHYGIDTQFPLDPHDYDISKEVLADCTMYGGSSPDLFQRAMACLPVDAHQWVFLDVGSGKGRVLLLAGKHPFKRVLGVEFSPALHEVAKKNLQIFPAHELKCADIQSILGNALSFPLPTERLVVYMFNPFGQESVRAFVEHMCTFLKTSSHELIFVYMVPNHAQVLANCPALREMTNVWISPGDTTLRQ
ncbi:MAG: class I SAM-dependent methyltransferase [Magnetococcales bacterium]|nr:class I SAM-dependent methyltransferase [Magnetococcales bacterium]